MTKPEDILKVKTMASIFNVSENVVYNWLEGRTKIPSSVLDDLDIINIVVERISKKHV